MKTHGTIRMLLGTALLYLVGDDQTVHGQQVFALGTFLLFWGGFGSQLRAALMRARRRVGYWLYGLGQQWSRA